jgi:hypothetical protein
MISLQKKGLPDFSFKAHLGRQRSQYLSQEGWIQKIGLRIKWKIAGIHLHFTAITIEGARISD